MGRVYVCVAPPTEMEILQKTKLVKFLGGKRVGVIKQGTDALLQNSLEFQENTDTVQNELNILRMKAFCQ